MSPEQWTKLITGHGNASFECGEWLPGADAPYETVYAASEVARLALLNAILDRDCLTERLAEALRKYQVRDYEGRLRRCTFASHRDAAEAAENLLAEYDSAKGKS